jgi:hypothetical protein
MGWIQVGYIWYIIRTFANETMYSCLAQQLEKKKKERKKAMCYKYQEWDLLHRDGRCK